MREGAWRDEPALRSLAGAMRHGVIRDLLVLLPATWALSGGCGQVSLGERDSTVQRPPAPFVPPTWLLAREHIGHAQSS